MLTRPDILIIPNHVSGEASPLLDLSEPLGQLILPHVVSEVDSGGAQREPKPSQVAKAQLDREAGQAEAIRRREQYNERKAREANR